MAFFNSKHTNYQRVEREFEAYERVITDKKLQQSLGTRASALVELADKFFVPNFRNGLITLPRRYIDSDLTPVLPVRKDEKLRISSAFARFSPRQRRSASKILSQLDVRPPVNEVEQALWGTKQPTVYSKLPAHAEAIVLPLSSDLLIIPKDTDSFTLHAYARPLVLIDRESPTSPSGLGHELMHVVQYSNSPLEVPSGEETTNRERREVEAYIVGAAIEQFEDLGHTRQQRFVEAGRRLSQLDEPIKVTDLFRNYLKSNGFIGWNK